MTTHRSMMREAFNSWIGDAELSPSEYHNWRHSFEAGWLARGIEEAEDILRSGQATQATRDDYAALAETGIVDPRLYHIDAVYHAIVTRIYAATPEYDRARDRSTYASLVSVGHFPHFGQQWATGRPKSDPETSTERDTLRDRVRSDSGAFSVSDFPPGPDQPEWVELAHDIRSVDGNHDLGASTLAEALTARGWMRRAKEKR